MSLIAIVTTLPSREQALALARGLVEEQLVACAQLTEIESVYLWEGQLEQTPEFRLTLKASESQYEAIEAAILARHPYALPAIHAQRLDRVHGPYGQWISERTGQRATTQDHPGCNPAPDHRGVSRGA